MRRKDIVTLVVVAVVTAGISMILSTLLFSPPKHNATIPSVYDISKHMPDIKNDPNYNTIFNDKALDPAQPVKIGGSQNATPFNSP